jgi:hypothetical protein
MFHLNQNNQVSHKIYIADMLPHYHITYKDIILPNVLI